MTRPHVDLAPPVRQEGPAYQLMQEHWRRAKRTGGIGDERTYWHWWDADDYSLDAPDELPAGSCVGRGPWLGCAQSVALRGQA